ncbi:hypothetical protein ACWEKR_03750 [Nocardia sp. NPDC004573]
MSDSSPAAVRRHACKSRAEEDIVSTEQVNRSAGVPGSRTPEAPFAPGHRGDGRVLSPPLPDYVAGADIADILTEDVPRPVAPPADLPFPQPRRLRAGCYLLRYTPTPHATVGLPVHYDGTLRVERDEVNTIASGDLYLHQPQLTPLPPREPDPALGVPIFPIADYRYYVRVTQILEGAAQRPSRGRRDHRRIPGRVPIPRRLQQK